MKILIVEDQTGLVEAVKQGLEEVGLEIEIAHSGTEGEELIFKNHYNVIVLDILMPGINGLELCKKARQANIKTPILFISALDAVDDKIAGLEAGGDDYLAKPFEFQELLARIKALDRRNNSEYNQSSYLKIADLEIDFEKWTAHRNKVDLGLTKKEFKLLEYFVLNEGRILSKSEISEKVWDVDFDTGTNIVEVYVNYLRNKLDKGFENKLIQTKFGVGYVFNPR